MENREYLPIGTVVLLKGGEKKLMITGFCVIPNDNEHKLYDYCGFPFPEGVMDSNEVHLFNHTQIEEVCFRGYENEEERYFKVELKEAIKDIVVDDDSNIVDKNLSNTIEYLNNPVNINENIFEQYNSN